MATFHLSIKSGKKGTAANHAAYIAREGKFSKGLTEPDLVAMEWGNMPEWAIRDPKLFWKMADQNERHNGAAYREFEIALPSELTLEQQRDLVDEFISKEVGNKPYQFAIHSPKSSIAGVDQTHGHIMLSDRIPDGIERTPEQMFKRFNSSNPALGGCKKDSGGVAPVIMKSELKTCRANFADLQNRHLEKHGHPARVDHRSNADHGLTEAPERHLGTVGVKKLSPEEKTVLVAQRQSKQKSVQNNTNIERPSQKIKSKEIS
jgi:hypothetical protein